MRLHLALAAPWVPVIAFGCASAPPETARSAAASDQAFCITTTPYPPLQGTRIPGWWRARFGQKCKEAEAGGFDVLFVGDSITQGWEKAGKAVWDRDIAPLKAANFGYSGDRTEHVLWRLDHGELHGKLDPKVVVVMIGTNNTGHRMDPPADIFAGVAAVVGRLTARLPKAQILLLDLFPRDERPDGEMRRNNMRVNARLAGLDGAAGGRVHFFPIGEKFLDPDGRLPRTVMPDGLHPDADGYEIWSAAMVPEIRKWLAQ